MKIAILSLRSRFGDVTGDCVQAEKTTEALVELGENAARYYLEPSTGEVYNSLGASVGKWHEAFVEHDIVHAIPPIPSKFIDRLPKIRAKLVCSTVFWRSLTYTRTVHLNVGRLTLSLIKEYVRDILALIGIRALNVYKAYDLLLPNSEDEIRVVKKYANLKRGVRLVAIPNAIDPLPANVSGISRPDSVPPGDYILVPCYFAPRKNQMTLIKAMGKTDYNVVFMGKGPLEEMCKRIANKHMLFLGHIEHGSDEFYSLMKYAKVVCLPSNCETPGIAGLEAAALGARPVVPYEGGTCQYYGWVAEYLNPLNADSIRYALREAWSRGRLSESERHVFISATWKLSAERTLAAYRMIDL